MKNTLTKSSVLTWDQCFFASFLSWGRHFVLRLPANSDGASLDLCVLWGPEKKHPCFSGFLSELIENVKLIHKPVSLQPRGLINKGNWCYINAVSFSVLWARTLSVYIAFKYCTFPGGEACYALDSKWKILQALIACPPMYHLMKSIPIFNETQRPCTSTPMMDNLWVIMNLVSLFFPFKSRALKHLWIWITTSGSVYRCALGV